MKQRVVFVDVDDTLIRSVGSKRIPMPSVVSKVRALHASGAIVKSNGRDHAASTVRGRYRPLPGTHLTAQRLLLRTSPPSRRVLLLRIRQAMHPQTGCRACRDARARTFSCLPSFASCAGIGGSPGILTGPAGEERTMSALEYPRRPLLLGPCCSGCRMCMLAAVTGEMISNISFDMAMHSQCAAAISFYKRCWSGA